MLEYDQPHSRRSYDGILAALLELDLHGKQISTGSEECGQDTTLAARLRAIYVQSASSRCRARSCACCRRPAAWPPQKTGASR